MVHSLYAIHTFYFCLKLRWEGNQVPHLFACGTCNFDYYILVSFSWTLIVVVDE